MKYKDIINKIDPGFLEKINDQHRMEFYASIGGDLAGFLKLNKKYEFYFDEERFNKTMDLFNAVVKEYTGTDIDVEKIRNTTQGLYYDIDENYAVNIQRRGASAALGKKSLSTTVCIYYPNQSWGRSYLPFQMYYNAQKDKYCVSGDESDRPYETDEGFHQSDEKYDTPEQAVSEAAKWVDVKIDNSRKYYDLEDREYHFKEDQIKTLNDLIDEYKILHPAKASKDRLEKYIENAKEMCSADITDEIEPLVEKKYEMLYVVSRLEAQHGYIDEIGRIIAIESFLNIEQALERRIDNYEFDKTCKTVEDYSQLEQKAESDMIKKLFAYKESENRKFDVEKSIKTAYEKIDKYDSIPIEETKTIEK